MGGARWTGSALSRDIRERVPPSDSDIWPSKRSARVPVIGGVLWRRIDHTEEAVCFVVQACAEEQRIRR